MNDGHSSEQEVSSDEFFPEREKITHKHDPDPFVLLALVLAAVSTAGTVYSAMHSRAAEQRRQRERIEERRAAALRWEADLLELAGILREIREFVSQPHFFEDSDIAFGKGKIEPLQTSVFYSHGELRQYRRLISRLLTRAKKIHESAFKLLPLVADEVTSVYLRDTVQSLKENLSKMRDMHGVIDNLSLGIETTEMLQKTARFLAEQ